MYNRTSKSMISWNGMMVAVLTVIIAQFSTIAADATQHKTSAITGYVSQSIGANRRQKLERVSGVSVIVATLHGKPVANIRSGKGGYFYIAVKPGIYRVSSCGGSSSAIRVNVRKGEHASIKIRAYRC